MGPSFSSQQMQRLETYDPWHAYCLTLKSCIHSRMKTNKLDEQIWQSYIEKMSSCIIACSGCLVLWFTFQKTTRLTVSELCITWIVASPAPTVPRRSASIAVSFRVTFSGFNCVEFSRRVVGQENLMNECFKSTIESWPRTVRIHS